MSNIKNILTDPFNRKNIISVFSPFNNHQSILGMVIGNDLDALLSACLLHHKFGWNIVGIYEYESLWFSAEYSQEEFFAAMRKQNFIAVDLDIYRNYLPSIGHHIISLCKDDVLPQHEKTLNPNLLRCITHKNFKQKYPMGTVHFLMWLFNEYPQFTRLGELLLWLADSTYINAQSHRFHNNVKDWLSNYVPNRILQNGFVEVDSELFENEIKTTVIPELEKTGLAQGKGQVKSRHLKLQGYQCQWTNPNHSRKSILSLLDVIYKNTDWTPPALPEKFTTIKGRRQTYRFSKMENKKKGFLRNFLSQDKVFSYVITNKYLINYTTHIDFN